ncbi:MAG: DUF5655 domain-containing protein [Patescibacteria group bacterium]|nr:DUF5655 domain-containing protein [Patescibacteria group bacterium]
MPKKTKLWKCPKCHREFAKINQQHSCKIYPLENHFANKEYAKQLFDYLVKKIEKNIGPLKIESLPCCIHLVSNYTFGAVWTLRDRVRIDFRISAKIETKKKFKIIQMSPNRYLYYLDIFKKSEIDLELLSYLHESYKLNFLKN